MYNVSTDRHDFWHGYAKTLLRYSQHTILNIFTVH